MSLFLQSKNSNLQTKIDEVEVRTKKIEKEVNQEKMEYISYAYNEEITYLKKGRFREGFK